MQPGKLKKWISGIYWLLTMLYWETLVHWGMFGTFQPSYRFALGLTAAGTLVLVALTGFFSGGAAFAVHTVLSVVIMLIYGSQLVYCFIFGTPYSLAQIGLGGEAVSQFWRETLSAMQEHVWWMLGLLLPILILALLRRAGLLCKPGWQRQGVMLLLAAALGAAVWLGVCRGGTDMYSDYYFLTSPRSTTTQTMERFGLPATFFVELTQTAEDEEEEEILLAPVVIPETNEPEQEETAEEAPVTYNVLDVDMDALNQATTNRYRLALNDYYAQQPGTNRNAYTGMLKDYNLIVICAESFSPAAVDPVITPTLYKLTQEGFLFRNYYNTFPNTTTDGEYALLQGLYPDSIRGKFDSSMMSSTRNLLPYALGNIFAEQRGIKSWGYHANIGDFYSRSSTHPNMGYDMQFNHKGMELGNEWPTSDLKMMMQSVDDYIDQPQFHAYYMTFSGHYQYRPSVNAIARKNYDLVDKPGYCMEQKAYLACHIELDWALEYLMVRLKQAGIAEKTAIVIAADHVPYGLLKPQYFGMIGQPEDFFRLYKSDLIFWVGGMEESVEVDEYCCNVDILPTILNLWGFDFDSRLLAGTDIFSDGPHAAVLIDRSFLTDQVWFNSNTRELRYLVDESKIPEDYVENMNRYIASRFDFSAQVLRQDYYRFVFGEKS